MAPNAGLSGADVSNIWLARVGAMNNLSGQLGQVKATGAQAVGSANANMIGAIVSAGQGTVQNAAQFFNTPQAASTPNTGNVALQQKFAGGIGLGQ
jgi:hypothetical protein